ncbi:MAG: DUF2277 domain-containing protein [Oceanospirillaceae bacterium]|nr:DUF2277 domain-containing protein [Oceanospirillaceae bacterium]
MCRNIKTLYNFEPAVTEAELQGAALQFIRKVSGSQKLSIINQHAFDLAVSEVALSVQKLFDEMVTTSPTKNREEEARKAKIRSQQQFS